MAPRTAPRTLFVRPGRKIDPDTLEPTVLRDPDTNRTIPWEGAEVPDNSYWRRRVRDGSAKIVDPKKKGMDDDDDDNKQPTPAKAQPAQQPPTGQAQGTRNELRTEPGASGMAKEHQPQGKR